MRPKFKLSLPSLLVALLLVSLSAWAQRPCQVTASVNPRMAIVGETMVYVVQVKCARAEEPPQVQPPDIFDSGLTELVSRGTTQQTTIVNGVVSTTYEFRYTLTALKPGTYKLPPANVAVDGEIYTTNEVTIEVQSARATTAGNVPNELRELVVPPKVPSAPQLEKALEGKIFILATVETTTPLSGQQFLLSYHLFIDQEGLSRAGIDPRRFSGTGNLAIPQLKEFLKEELYPVPQNLRFEEQTVGGQRYAVAPLYQVALTPTRTGTITIEPFQLGLVFPLTQQRRSRSPFDDPLLGFFDLDPFDARGVEVIVRSVPIELNVAPLPAEGKPADFCGAVGRFRVDASVDKTHVKANEDIIRLRVTLTGEGNATVAVAPEFPSVDGVVLLEEPKVSTDRRIENNKVITSKTFDYLLRVTREGKHKIPSLSLAVFNPATKRYEQLSTPEFEIIAAPGTASPVLVAPQSSPAPPQTAASKSDKEVRKDLRYIKELPGRWTTRDALRREMAAAGGVMAASTAAFLLSWAWARRRVARRNVDLEQLRRKNWNALQLALGRLERANQDDAAQAAAQFAEALRRYVASLLDTEVELLTAEELSEALVEAGLKRETALSLREILETCESVKYSPLASSPDFLANMATRTRQLLKEVQQCFER